MVAVGTEITLRPPHRSGLADFPHPALVEGRTRSAFGALGAHVAPIRGLAASVTCQVRRWVRGMRCCSPFLRPAAFPPPSPPPMSLGIVRGFIGTMQPSDSSHLPIGLRYLQLPRLARDRDHGCGRREVSQVPYKGRNHVLRVSDCARFIPCKPFARGMMLPSLQRNEIGTSEFDPFRSSMPGPVVAPVNASRRPSRDAAHHSGTGRLARPYPVEDLHLLSFASLPGALS